MPIFSPMGKAKFYGVAKARFDPIDQFRDESKGPDGFCANPLSSQEGLEIRRLVFMGSFQNPHQPSRPPIPENDPMSPWKLQVPKSLNLRSDPAGMLRGDLGCRLPDFLTFPGDHVENFPPVVAADCGVRFTYETIQPKAHPMVSTGVAGVFVHSLLHNTP